SGNAEEATPSGRPRECSDQQGARGDRLRPQVHGDLPAPRPHLVGYVVYGPAQGVRPGRSALLGLGDHRHQIDLFARSLGPQVTARRRLQLGRERRGIGAQIEHLGPGSLLGLAHLHGLPINDAGDGRPRVIQVARDDRLLRANDHARRLEPYLDAMRTVVAFRGSARVRVDVERVVRTRLHAALAADAPGAVEVDDAVGTPVERHRRADRHAGRVVAVVTPQHREVSARLREGPALDVLHRGAKGAQRTPVLFLARHRAGMTADAAALIDHEPVAHVPSPTLDVRAAGRRGAGAPPAEARLWISNPEDPPTP